MDILGLANCEIWTGTITEPTTNPQKARNDIESRAFNSYSAQREIDTYWDALEHYRSHAGGSVPASKKLIEALISSPDYIKNANKTKKQIEDSLNSMSAIFCSGKANKTGKLHRQGAPYDKNNPKQGIAVDSLNNALGKLSVYIDPYVVEWNRIEVKCTTGTMHYILYAATRRVYFRDRYIFNKVETPDQIWTDFLPSIIAGDGTPYYIEGETVDSLQGFVIIKCNN